MQSNRDALIQREEEALAAARSMSRLAPWQIRAAYYLAMLNNEAQREGTSTLLLRLTPGKMPKVERVEE
jgi:hypothetical protein